MITNFSFYSFFELSNPYQAKKVIESRLLALEDVRGTLLLAPEGVNLNLASADSKLRKTLVDWLQEISCKEKTEFKSSYSQKNPFKKLKVRLKRELCALGDTQISVPHHRADYISTEEFRALLENPKKDVLILDNRNNFEYAMGTFKGAVPVGTRRFRYFIEKSEELPKEKEIVMFCTGGIRCEKAGAFLKAQGFDRVKQLDGGILRYFEEQQGAHFEGKCFVFDERESVDGELNPENDDH